MPARPKRIRFTAVLVDSGLAGPPSPGLLRVVVDALASTTGVNISRDSFTSGPRTLRPMDSHSAMKWATFSELPSSELSMAAMNCTG